MENHGVMGVRNILESITLSETFNPVGDPRQEGISCLLPLNQDLKGITKMYISFQKSTYSEILRLLNDEKRSLPSDTHENEVLNVRNIRCLRVSTDQ